METKKKKGIIKYFLKMAALFFIFLLAQQLISSILLYSLKTERYGNEALFELIWAGLVLILLIIYKNRYIFRQDRVSFFKGFKYIIPEFIISIFFLIISIATIVTSEMPINILSILNLLIYCLFIGIVEEFLCRGWLLNEFLEKFSNNKKEKILSIVLSSFIFGVIHFFNVGSGQNIVETCVQVVNAGVSGMFLALVYYKTKNIWLVVFSHAFWDFTIMLTEHNQLVECYNTNATSPHVVLASIVSGIIIIIGYLTMCYWLYRKTDLYEKNSNKSKNYLVPIGIIIYIVGILSSAFILSDDEYQVCPIYKDKNLSNDYVLIINNYHKFELSGSNNDIEYNYELFSDDEKEHVILHDSVTDKKVVLADSYYDYLLVDNEDSFSIIIQTDTNKVLYGTFKKGDINDFAKYSEYIKNNLHEYYTPEISLIAILNEKGNKYNYIVLDTEVNERMIFDEESKLYFINFE